ncbi:hypothetical protein DFJ73DRAFT_503252 [Zopfochytrium polystomum]|nr:hypothetical protein DFJ73DRAFT_503252 [Zopfochytrium polystomum]
MTSQRPLWTDDSVDGQESPMPTATVASQGEAEHHRQLQHKQYETQQQPPPGSDRVTRSASMASRSGAPPSSSSSRSSVEGGAREQSQPPRRSSPPFSSSASPPANASTDRSSDKAGVDGRTGAVGPAGAVEPVVSDGPGGSSLADRSNPRSPPTTPAAAPWPSASQEEYLKVFVPIEENVYRGGATGRADMEAAPCMCKYDPDRDARSMACGDDSDCINRVLFWECPVDECPCDVFCLNRRFRRKDYAPIEVIKTEKKGFGLRAKGRIARSQFVIEYCGEVLPTTMFAKRAREYAESGVQHFYFMSIKSDEIIDAYRKGNIARFMNHSCVPNCELQKWVVGTQIRMGIFALRDIELGEELTFDYKFERYGDTPQICYCGEAACKGTIGGGKQSALKAAPDLYDESEEFERSGRRSPRKIADGDEDYVESQREPKGLETNEDVQKLVRSLLNSAAKPTKTLFLLRQVEATQTVQIQRRFLHYHGLLVLRSVLVHNLRTNNDVCYQTLCVLKSLPSVSRNSIVDSKLEDVVTKLADSSVSNISDISRDLLAIWSQLPVVYKIPKRVASEDHLDDSKKREAESPADSDERKRGRFDSDKKPAVANDSPTISNGFLKKSTSDARPSSIDSPTFSTGSAGARADEPVVFHPKTSFVRKQSEDSSKAWTALKSPSSFLAVKHPPGNGVGSSMAPNSSPVVARPVDSALAELPKQWRAATTEDGKIYYYNTETRATQWERPQDPNAPIGNVPPSNDETPAVAKLRSTLVEGVSDMDIEAILEAAAAAAQTNNERGPGSSESSSIKELREGISLVVVKTLSKYKSELSNEKFKKLARKVSLPLFSKRFTLCP